MRTYHGATEATSLHANVSQEMYNRWGGVCDKFVKGAWRSAIEDNELVKLDEIRNELSGIGQGFDPRLPYGIQKRAAMDTAEEAARAAKWGWRSVSAQFGKAALAGLIKANVAGAIPLAKAGVTSALGYNFYDLRAPVFLIYPVNVPMRNQLPRVGRVNDGYGTAAHWMATRNPGILYAGVPEGQRAPIATPDNNQYIATYKELGVERGVTFTAQFAGEGFADNLADEHLRGLQELWLQEEGIIWGGNSGTGTGNNGFALGTCPTPTTAVTASHTVGKAGNLGTVGNADLPYTTVFTTSNYVTVACVALTAMGNPANSQYGYGVFPSIAGGLTPSYQRVGADGSQTTIPGGMSAMSALSNTTQLTSNNLTILAKLPTANLPVKGAFGYAWFVDTETSSTGSLGSAYLAGITSTPFAYISGTATGSQPANATNGSLPGFTSDNSFCTLDFDGLLTYQSSTPGAYYNDLSAQVALGNASNNSLTSGKDGSVNEVEAALEYIFINYQAGVDEIWGDATAVQCLQKAIRWSGTNASGYQFITTRDGQNNMLGGFVISAYQSRYAVANPTGGNAIPIRMHPMVPPGTLYFHVRTNPYPHSRVGNVVDMLVQRDYYSIEWPLTTRQWTFGTYVHEVIRHTMPWIPAMITGIGPFVSN